VLRRIFGPRKEEVTGAWRKLHKEELNELNSSPNIIRVINPRSKISSGHVAGMGKRLGLCRVLVGKREGNRTLGRPRRRWEDNSKLDLQEVVYGVCTGSMWLRRGTGGGHL